MTTEVFVAHGLVDQCEKFADRVVAGYKAGRKNHSRSMDMNGISSNPTVQAAGRLGEVAMCIFLGLDPYKSLDWKMSCDAGFDLRMLDGRSVDVKASLHPGARRLIWPVTKMHFLDKAADVLVFARTPINRSFDIGRIVELVGWTTRERFIREKTIAKGERGIVDGTAYLFETRLDMMDKLGNYKQS